MKWPRSLYWLRLQLTRIQRRLLLVSTVKSWAELEELRAHFAEAVCPGCHQKSLVLERLERGPEGWELEFSCTNCVFRGVLNSEGHRFTGLHLKKK